MMNLIGRFRERLPGKQVLLNVYSVIVFMVYTWTMAASFWKLPSWMFYLNPGQIVSIYAYSFMFDFAETVLLMVFCLLVCVPLFAFWGVKEGFQSRSVTILMILLGSSMLRLTLYRDPEYREDFVNGQLLWWGISIFFSTVLGWAVPKISWLKSSLETLADKTVIFLFIYLPLTVISFIAVIIRNL
jgi:hypothetical protein